MHVRQGVAPAPTSAECLPTVRHFDVISRNRLGTERMICRNRVNMFCDWLASVPDEPPFQTRPEYAFFSEMTPAELDAAEHEMVRRLAAVGDEAIKIVNVAAAFRTAVTPANDHQVQDRME